MKCEQNDCTKKSKWMCMIHRIKFCGLHYEDHSIACENKATPIKHIESYTQEYVKKVNLQFDHYKKQALHFNHNQMINLKNSMKHIQDSTKILLTNLENQRKILVSKIIEYRLEKEILQFLGVYPIQFMDENIPSVNSNFSQFEVQGHEAFLLKINEIQSRINVNQPSELEISSNMSLENKIARCSWLGLDMMYKTYIIDIRITKNVRFVFVCKLYIDCKSY